MKNKHISDRNHVQRAVHGALDYAELALLDLSPDQILDFSVNANPYGPSPLIREAIAHVVLDRYPDRECARLRQAILDYEWPSTQLSLNSLVCGNGANELIWAIARAYLQPGQKAAIIGPTFGEYRAASLASHATVIAKQAKPAEQFQHDLDEICSWIYQERPHLVWLCNPNNPTGTLLNMFSMLRIAKECQHVGAMLVVDESYVHFVVREHDGEDSDAAVALLACAANLPSDPTCNEELPVIVLRSLTKDFALAGLRLGYAVSSEDVIQHICTQLPAWNVSAIAQVAGCVALADRTHLETTLAQLASERQAFFHSLYESDFRVIPSRTHFCLIEVGDAQLVRRRLLERKLLVRDCTSFGLPQYIRVATRSSEDWQQLVDALREIVKE